MAKAVPPQWIRTLIGAQAEKKGKVAHDRGFTIATAVLRLVDSVPLEPHFRNVPCTATSGGFARVKGQIRSGGHPHEIIIKKKKEAISNEVRQGTFLMRFDTR
jgi:hypothetical protein